VKYIGIDPSYTGFGITVLDDNGTHDTRVWKFDPRRCGGSGVNQLNTVMCVLQEYLTETAPREEYAHVAVEGYAYGARYGLTKSGELGGAVKLTLYEFFDDPVRYPTIVPPPRVKRYATGSGDASKDMILLEVYKRWDVEFPHIPSRERHNAADSYVLAHIARDLHRGYAEFGFQRDLLEDFAKHTERPGSDFKKKRRAA